MIKNIKNLWSVLKQLCSLSKNNEKNKKETHKIIMKHLENTKINTMKFYNPAIKQEMTVEEIREELERRYSISGQGKTCMIPNKYSREYTDYYLNQLAKFFGFDFFKNRINDLKLEKNQRFKSMREIIEESAIKSHKPHLLKNPDFAARRAQSISQKCEKLEVSLKSFQDMMFFDSLIMNNKRSIDNFGFIVDTTRKDEFGEIPINFICFYDEYNSFFDHLNGITDFDQYQRAIMNVESWTDNKWHREYADDLGPRFGRLDHIEKLKELNELTGTFKFKDNDQFQLDEYHFFKHEYIKQNIEHEISVYQYRLHDCATDWPDRIDFNIGLHEILNNKEKLENQLERSKNYDPEKKEREIPEEQKHLYKIWLEDKFYVKMWRNVKVRPKLQKDSA